MLTHLRFKAAHFIVALTLLCLPAAGVTAAFSGPSGDYGDAPEGTLQGTNFSFPTALEGREDARYVMHYLPQERVFLGDTVTSEYNALEVDQDVDDGWLVASAQTCTPIQYEVRVTVPAGAVAGPIYLNVLFDWNHDGRWSGADHACPVGTQLPSTPAGRPWATPLPLGPFAVEWGVQNLRLDAAPFNVHPGFSGNVLLPAVLTGTQPGALWMRFTVSTEPVDEQAFLPVALNGQGWSGQGNFIYGETEDYRSCLVEAGTQIPGCPATLAQAQPTDPAPQPRRTASPIIPPVTAPASKSNGGDNSSAQNNQTNDSAQDDTGSSVNDASNDSSDNNAGGTGTQEQAEQDAGTNQEQSTDSSQEATQDDANAGATDQTVADGAAVGTGAESSGEEKRACNAGKGNGAEEDASGQDCDPGNSADHNNAGDGQTGSPADDSKGKDKKDK